MQYFQNYIFFDVLLVLSRIFNVENQLIWNHYQELYKNSLKMFGSVLSLLVRTLLTSIVSTCVHRLKQSKTDLAIQVVNHAL